jgi:hypothetical protein
MRLWALVRKEVLLLLRAPMPWPCCLSYRSCF